MRFPLAASATSPTPAGVSPSSGSTAGMTSISPMDLPGEPVTTDMGGMATGPMTVEAADPVAPAFGAASIAASIMVIFAAMVLINVRGLRAD